MFKIFKRLEIVEFSGNLIPKSGQVTRGHCFRYNREIAKNSARHNFLTNRISTTWNSLPKDLVNENDITKFKEKLDFWMSLNYKQ